MMLEIQVLTGNGNKNAAGLNLSANDYVNPTRIVNTYDSLTSLWINSFQIKCNHEMIFDISLS